MVKLSKLAKMCEIIQPLLPHTNKLFGKFNCQVTQTPDIDLIAHVPYSWEPFHPHKTAACIQRKQ